MRLYLASVTDYRLWGGGQNGIVSCRINGFISLQWQQHYTWQQYADHFSTHTHTHTQEMKLFLAGEHGTKNGLQRERERGWQLLEDNGLRRNADETKLLFYPKVGQPYWTVELEGGEYKVVAHDAPTCQEERPIHDLCFSTEAAAQRKVDELKRPRW